MAPINVCVLIRGELAIGRISSRRTVKGGIVNGAIRGLANFTRSTAPSNGMNAQRSAGGPLSSPAAAQRCAEGAGLDSGPLAEHNPTMPSIARPQRPHPRRPLSNPWLEPICWLRL